MARLGPSIDVPFAPRDSDWRAYYDGALDRLTKNRDPQAADLTGSMIRFAVADGYAYYVVAKHKPLTLSPVLIGDAYQVPAAMIRGLREDDVRDQLRRAAALAALFAKGAPA